MQTIFDKTAKFVRIITVAPIMAAMLILILYWQVPDFFGSTVVIVVSMLFLVIFPLLAYPLQPLIPKYKNEGRDGQRNLAMIFAAIGYVCTIGYAALSSLPSGVWIIYLTYLLSALLIIVFNKVIRLKASGHACGVAGPVWTLIWFVGVNAIVGLLLLAIVFWASLKTKRHKISELVAGTLIPAAAFSAAMLIVYIK